MQLGHILRWPFISFGVGHWRERKCLALRCGSTLNGPLGCEESAWSECPGTLSEVSEGALTLWISGDVRKACFRQVRRVEGRRAAGRAGSRKVGIEGMEQTDLGQSKALLRVSWSAVHIDSGAPTLRSRPGLRVRNSTISHKLPGASLSTAGPQPASEQPCALAQGPCLPFVCPLPSSSPLASVHSFPTPQVDS